MRLGLAATATSSLGGRLAAAGGTEAATDADATADATAARGYGLLLPSWRASRGMDATEFCQVREV
jgi:hypothetical protein